MPESQPPEFRFQAVTRGHFAGNVLNNTQRTLENTQSTMNSKRPTIKYMRKKMCPNPSTPIPENAGGDANPFE